MQTIPIHGTPITPKRLLDQMVGCSFCVSFARPDSLSDVMERQDTNGILVLDNGAFSIWRAEQKARETGQPVKLPKRLQFDSLIDYVESFWDWANDIQSQDLGGQVAVAVVPDVIGGSESANRDQLALALRDGMSWDGTPGYAQYPERTMAIWHMNESLDQLTTMSTLFNFVGIGSCAEYDVQTNRAGFDARMIEAKATIDAVEIDTGRRPWIHLMRGLGTIHRFDWINSADSTNVAQNHAATKHRENHVAAMVARVNAKASVPSYPPSAANFSQPTQQIDVESVMRAFQTLGELPDDTSIQTSPIDDRSQDAATSRSDSGLRHSRKRGRERSVRPAHVFGERAARRMANADVPANMGTDGDADPVQAKHAGCAARMNLENSSPEALIELMDAMQWKPGDVAEILRIDERQVRRYRSGATPIPYPVWFTLIVLSREVTL